MTKEAYAEVDKTVNYLYKLLQGWINGDATTPIPDKQFDLIRQWIQIAKQPRIPADTENTELQEYRDCLVKIRHYSTSKPVLDWINEIIPQEAIGAKPV